MGLALSSLYFMSLIIHCIVFYKSNSPGSIGMLKLPLYYKLLTGTGVDWPKKLALYNPNIPLCSPEGKNSFSTSKKFC